MARKPENQFIAGVHKYLPDVYFEKMNNPYRGGTADVWYSGVNGDLWLEYKYLPKVPTRGLIVPDLSELQKRWILNRRAEGRYVHVVVGCPAGGMWFTTNDDIVNGMPAASFHPVSREQLAEDIRAYVGTSPCKCPSSILQSGSSPRSTAS